MLPPALAVRDDVTAMVLRIGEEALHAVAGERDWPAAVARR
jgi:hypothetical protein